MNLKLISFDIFGLNTLKMFKKDSPIFLQNINMIARQLFLLFKKSTTFWDNPRTVNVVPFVCKDSKLSRFYISF